MLPSLLTKLEVIRQRKCQNSIHLSFLSTKPHRMKIAKIVQASIGGVDDDKKWKTKQKPKTNTN